MHRNVALIVVAGLAVSAHGQSKEWDGGAGNLDWFQGDNWDPDGVPGSGDAVRVQGAVPVAQAGDVNVLSLIVDDGMVLRDRSLYLAEPSRITNFTLEGCCSRSVVTQGLLTLAGQTRLLKRTLVSGPGGVRLNEYSVAVEGMRIDGTTVTVAGILDAQGTVEPRNAGLLDVLGTVWLSETAAIDESAGGGVRLNPGGSIGLEGRTPHDAAYIDSFLQTTGGRLYSEQGTLDIRGSYELFAVDLDVEDDGRMTLSGSMPNEVESVTFGGEGRIELRNANNVYKGAINADVTDGVQNGLVLLGTTRLDGLISNTGLMQLGTLLTSPGGTGAVLTSGRLLGGGTTEVPIAVDEGGALEVTSITLKADVDVFSGGAVWLGGPGSQGSSINAPSSGTVGRIRCEGLIRARDDQNCTQLTSTVGVPVDLMPGGEITIESGGLVLNGGGQWSGGTLAPGDTGCFAAITVNGFNVTTSVTGDVVGRPRVGGSLILGGPSHTLSVSGTLRTEGHASELTGVTLNGRSIGSGQIVHELEALKLESGCDLGARLVNDALVIVRGGIQLRSELRNEVEGDQRANIRFESGTLNNNGLWAVNSTSDQLNGSGGSITNTGEYRVGSSGAGGFGHRVFVRFDNQGSVVAEDAHVELHDVAQIVGSELRGGLWIAFNAGSITFPGTSVSKIIGINTTVTGDEGTLPWLGDLEEVGGGASVELTGDTSLGSGVVVGDGSVRVGDGVEFDCGGDVELQSPSADLTGLSSFGLIPDPATIVAASTNSHGRIIPGGEDRAGQFDFMGNVTQFDDGRLLIDVGGADNTDVITVTGAATLGGTLCVRLIDGFVPQGGESYRLIDTQGGVFGDFATLDLPELPDGLSWEVYTGELFVGLSVLGGSCTPDWNGDGTVNTLDFIAFLGDWSSGDASADLNGDGSVNTIDFIAFLNAWVAGC